MKMIKTTKSFCKELNEFFHRTWLPKSRLMPQEWVKMNDLAMHTGLNDWSFVVFDPEEFPQGEKDKHQFFPIGKERFGIVLSGAVQKDEEVFNFLHHLSGTNVYRRSA